MKKYPLLGLMIFCLQLSGVEYKPVSYEYLLDKTPKIEKSLMRIHFELYQGYVKQVNLLNKLLEETSTQTNSANSFQFQAIKRQYGWEFNGMVLHELFFSNLGSQEKLAKNAPLYKKITAQWGSYDKWLDEFKQTCLQRGVGWTILYYDTATDSLYNSWVSDHADGPLVTGAPILVVDLWEHAYLCQFKTDRKSYVDAIFESVDWSVVNQRLKDAASSERAKQARRSKQAKVERSQKSTEK